MNISWLARRGARAAVDGESGAIGGFPEAAVVLAAGAGIVAVALAGGNSLLTDSSVQAAISELTSFQGRMRNAHASVGFDYGNAAIDDADIIAAGYAPRSMVSGTALQSRWRTGVDVTGAGSTFVVEIAAVPQEDCIALIQQLQPPVAVSARVASSSGGIAAASVIVLPASRSAAVAGCANTTNVVAITME